jgi:dipeptidyl-peptidase-4
VKRQISFVACFALLAFILGLFSTAGAQTAPTKPLTIETLYQPGGLAGRGPETVEWSPDSTKLTFVQRDEKGEKGELWYVDAATGEKKVLVSAEKLASLDPDVNKVKNEREKERRTRYRVAAYLWAPDSKHLIFDSQGQLWLYDLGSETAVQFTSAPDPSGDPKFSPDGAHLAYVRKHNLYVRPVNGQDEKQLTKDTGDDLFNGDIDWVYTEELGVRSNYFWSPDSKEIVFLHMDESKVPIYPITDWLPTHPSVDNEKYPKVGDPNPVVKLGVVGPDKDKVRWISLSMGADEEAYVPRFGWVKEGVIWAALLNRTQDKMELFFIDAKTGKSRLMFTETTPDAWIDFENVEIPFLKSGGFLWRSWRDGHTHIYLYSFDKQNPMAADAKLERQLESGDYEVLGIDGVDEAAGTVFFAANKDDPRQRHIFSVQLDGSGFKALTMDEGIHAANFSADGKHYAHMFGAERSPSISLCAVGGSCSPVWQGRDEISEYGLRAPKYLEFKADDGTRLYGQLLLPPDAPASGKIPLIVYLYGGPAAQLVKKGTPDPFDEILARKGFAVFTVDNRGTPGRDRKFQTAIRHEFGAVELKDQLTALDQLYAQYPQLDKDRTGIWGWSNGGSMTLYAMTHSDRFRAGVAVAPVTSQVNYDSIYTERYMGLLKDDKAGYEQSDVTRDAANLHGALLLVHGTSDDNVHFQNSIQMINSLINAGKPFRLMIYPNKTHSIAGKDARVHLFNMIVDHFERELK